MKPLNLHFLWIFLLAVLIPFSSCKKKIFSKTTLSGKVVTNYTNMPVASCSVVLFKKRGSALAKNGIVERDKEICRETTDGSGNFSMDLKWLDNRDTYYISIYVNNTPQNIASNNFRFGSYKALESNVEFRIDI